MHVRRGRSRAHTGRRAGAALALLLAAGLPVPARSAAAQEAGPLAGVVQAEDDSPLLGARVTLWRTAGDGTPRADPARSAVTTEGGNFRFANVGPGWARLVVRRLGFRPETLAVEVPQPAGGRLVVPLQRVSQVLGTVVVRATVARGPISTFERRRASGFGRFVTRADIERRRPQRTTDILRNVPGLTVERGETGTPVPRFRNATVGLSGAACYPTFWIDGVPLGPTLDMDALNPGAIEGIELYSGIATVPPALRAGLAPGTCGVVAIWTRHGEARPRTSAAPGDAEQLDALVASGHVFTADQVDAAAKLLPDGGPAPAYPESLRATRTAGLVVLEFVVDELGQPDEETLGVVSATQPEFADAARAAMPGVRFSPAVRRGRAVRQVVHLPVLFDPGDPSVRAPVRAADRPVPAAP